MREIYVIAHDMRSAHNVGSLLRTAEGLGVNKIFLTGYTPYPKLPQDTRLPHIADKLSTRIYKTSLGAEHMVAWEYHPHVMDVLYKLKRQGVIIAALEQTDTATNLPDYMTSEPVAILLGTEVTGLPASLLAASDIHLVIPMLGQKESFNVVQAAAMALYHIRFYT